MPRRSGAKAVVQTWFNSEQIRADLSELDPLLEAVFEPTDRTLATYGTEGLRFESSRARLFVRQNPPQCAAQSTA